MKMSYQNNIFNKDFNKFNAFVADFNSFGDFNPNKTGLFEGSFF